MTLPVGYIFRAEQPQWTVKRIHTGMLVFFRFGGLTRFASGSIKVTYNRLHCKLASVHPFIRMKGCVSTFVVLANLFGHCAALYWHEPLLSGIKVN